MPKNADIRDNAFFVMAGLILVNVFWGASSIAAREALLQLNAIEIVTIRFTIALLIVFGMAVAMKKWNSLKIDTGDIPMFILLSLSNVSIGFILQVESLSYTTVTNFSLEFNLATFFIMLMGAFLLGERLTRKKMAGAGIAFAGTFLIISGGRPDLSSAHLPGDLMGVGSAVAFGLFTIASKKISSKYGLTTILLYTFCFGVLELLPFYVLGTPMTPLTTLSALSWSSLLFLAVLCSVFCFFVYTHGLSRLKASDVAMSIYVTPLAGILLAVLLLGETLTAVTAVGAGLIMAGMYLTQQELEPDMPENLYTPLGLNE
ncbi:MAG TPA: DMT family transporter [Methanocella sp.]|uniref:DMT family transporter n=1 Tax=Methanocella sp. TaxID=2052833 RepID=UPI002C9D6C14|nr:DMT family transporter [Methanocella sp.]HTY89970.1 DMT family transporter [Methanocella sp.]